MKNFKVTTYRKVFPGVYTGEEVKEIWPGMELTFPYFILVALPYGEQDPKQEPEPEQVVYIIIFETQKEMLRFTQAFDMHAINSFCPS